MLDESSDSNWGTDPFVYRVITPEDWKAAQASGHIPSVAVDRQDGYFHLSPHGQILTTASLYFRPDEAPGVLEFDAEAQPANVA